MSYHPPHMKDARRAALAALVCAVARAGGLTGSRPRRRRHAGPHDPAVGAAAQFPDAEEAARACLLHQLHAARQRSTRLVASFGALERNDESRNRFATVEVRVGDYDLDNTHPIRGDSRAMGPRVSRVALPLTDDEQPIRLALWRATDRTFKQASEALDARQDQRRREGQGRRSGARLLARRSADLHRRHRPATRSTRRRGKRACGGSRRPSPTTRSCSAATCRCRSNPTTATTPTAKARRSSTGDVACRLFIQAVTKADDGMELPLYQSYFATLAVRAAGRETADRGRPQHDGPARAPAEGAARRSVLGPGDSFGPRGRRVLPRDLRPPRRGQPPAERRRRPDVRQQGRAARAAGVPERRVRSDAAEARQRRADGPLPVRRRRASRRGA